MHKTVASDPSSTIWSGPYPFYQVRHCTVNYQYYLSVSPFHAKTVPVLAYAIAAAAWSWVEKILHEHHLTLAPSADNVYISTAVWIVICNDPDILVPLSGCDGPNSFLIAINPGISTSANYIYFLPQPARLISLTLD